MDNKKIAKVDADIAKTKAKLAELQTILKEQERQKLELENTNIVDIVRGLNISLAALPALLQAMNRDLNDTASVPAPSESRVAHGGTGPARGAHHERSGPVISAEMTCAQKEEPENE